MTDYWELAHHSNPVEYFKPGDIVSPKDVRGSAIALGSDGFINLTGLTKQLCEYGAKSTESCTGYWATLESFNSDGYTLLQRYKTITV